MSEKGIRVRPGRSALAGEGSLLPPVSEIRAIGRSEWTDLLARIGQKNSRLLELMIDPCPRAAPDPRHVSKPYSKDGGGNAIMRELERERSRIARDLHAGAGQPLAGIKLNLEMLDDCAGSLPQKGRDALARLQFLTDQALQQVRAVSHGLHPPEWQGLRIEQALRDLVQASGLMERLDVAIDIRHLRQEPAHAVKVAIYRCAQECIANVARHSDATKLKLSLSAQTLSTGESVIQLELKDNGSGFVTDPANHGIGLASIREHVFALGGTCQIGGGRQGVRVVVRMPVCVD